MIGMFEAIQICISLLIIILRNFQIWGYEMRFHTFQSQISIAWTKFKFSTDKREIPEKCLRLVSNGGHIMLYYIYISYNHIRSFFVRSNIQTAQAQNYFIVIFLMCKNTYTKTNELSLGTFKLVRLQSSAVCGFSTIEPYSKNGTRQSTV